LALAALALMTATQQNDKNQSKEGKKDKTDAGLTVLARLVPSSHSQVRSHYCSPRGLLAAGFPPWPGSPLLRQPGHPGLLQGDHIDDELSADTRSTWGTEYQNPWPQVILYTRPPSSWLTGARHNSQSYIDPREGLYKLRWAQQAAGQYRECFGGGSPAAATTHRIPLGASDFSISGFLIFLVKFCFCG